MTLNEILTFVAQVFFITLSLIAIFGFVIQPDPRRRDFALFCSALGIPLGVTFVRDWFGVEFDTLNTVGAIALFSQPYFLFRLLQYFCPSRPWIHWLIIVGTVASLAILFTYISVYPITTRVVVFGFCVVVDAYCTWKYSLAMRSSGGTLRRRLLLITLSAGLFTIALGGSALKAVIPSIDQPATALALTLTAISAVLYYIAFIPSRWLRHAWNYVELRDYLSEIDLSVANGKRVTENFHHLATAANQAVNGITGAVVHCIDDTWHVVGSTDTPRATLALTTAPDLFGEVWEQRQSRAIYTPDMKDATLRAQMQAVGGRTWLLVPIVATERVWGVLLVILRDRALFIDDDITLLEMFAQQSAMLHENNRLIVELEGYSEQLEHKVEERTQELLASENALRELNASLEQRVEQRTAELRRSNEELDNFAYVASHDLKSPLRAINHLAGWIEQDAGDLLPDESRGHLVKLQGRVNRMENLLNDLLAYSRVGRQQHPTETVQMSELIHDVAEVVAPPAGFSIKAGGEMRMHVERVPLETVFRNLIGNAIKHHHQVVQGCVEVQVENKGDFIKFSVADNGPGIAPEFHERVFEIFTTLQPRDQVEGSGIGLAIVKKSVESRGGEIWIDSALDHGTTIHFTWPHHDVSPPE